MGMRLSDLMQADQTEEPKTFRLGDLMSMERARGEGVPQFDLSGLVQVSDEQRNQWQKMGPIGYGEASRRIDKTEMIPFNPESAVKSVKLLNSVNRLRADQYAGREGQKAQDIDLVNNYLYRLEEEKVRGFTVGGKIIRGVSEWPGYMIEFLATGGAATLGKKAVAKSAEGVARKIVKSNILKFTTRTAGGVAGATARMAVMPHRVAEKYAQNQLNAGLEFTDDGIKIAEESLEKPHISFLKGMGDVVIENFSEVTGPSLSAGARRLMPKHMANAVKKLFQKIHPEKSVQVLFTKAGYHGFLEELGEERVGDLLRAVTGVQDFGAKDPANIFDRIISSIPDSEEMLVEAGVLAFPGAMRFAASKTVEAIKQRRQTSAKEGQPQPQDTSRELTDQEIAAMVQKVTEPPAKGKEPGTSKEAQPQPGQVAKTGILETPPEIVKFYESQIKESEPEAKIPLENFKVLSFAQPVMESIGSKYPDVFISSKVIKHIYDTRPELADSIIQNMPNLLNTSEVYKNPRRENSFIFVKREGKNWSTVLEIAEKNGRNEIVTIMTMPNKGIKKLEPFKVQVGIGTAAVRPSGPTEVGSIPSSEGPLPASGLSALQSEKSIPPAQDTVKKEQVAGRLNQLDSEIVQVDEKIYDLETEREQRSQVGKPITAISNKIDLLNKERDSLDVQRADLLTTSEKDLNVEKELILIQAKELRNIETRAKLEEARKVKQEIKAELKKEGANLENIKRTVIDFANKQLTLKDRGKFLTAVKNAKTQEDLNLAIDRMDKLAVAQDVRVLKSQIDKELKDTAVRKQAGKPVGKFTPEIQKILDKAREISGMTREQANEVLSANLDRAGEDSPSFDVAMENRLLSMMAGLENKDPADLEKILDDIQTLKSAGLAESFLKDLARKEETERIIATAKEVIIGDKLPSSDRFPSHIEEAKKNLKSFYRWLIGWNDKMDILSMDDKASKAGESRLSKIADVSKEVSSEKKGVRLETEKIRKMGLESFGFKNEKQLTRQLNADNNPISLGKFVDGFGKTVELKFTKSELRKRWMELRDPSLSETFEGFVAKDGSKHGMGYTEEMIRAIEGNLTQEDTDFARAQMDFYKEYYQGVNEIYRQIYGVDLPFNEAYSPIARKYTKETVADVFLREINFRRSVASGSLKSRVQNIRDIREQSDIEVLLRHVTEMEHFKSWVFKIRDLNAIFGNTEIRDVIEKKFGKDFLRSINNHIQDFTKSGTDTADNYKLLEKIRRRYTVSVLGGKAKIALTQLTSMFAYSEYIPAADYAKGVADFIRHPVEAAKILGESELVKQRSKDLNRDIKELVRMERYSLIKENPNFINTLLFNIRLGDKGAILTGGWAVYKYHLNKGKSHAEALAEFEKATAATQQSADIDQLSDWQRSSNSFQKLATMFMSSQNQYFRREVSAIRNLMVGRLPWPDALKRIAIYHFLLPMLAQLVADIGRWNEKHQARAALLGSLNGVFILANILDGVAAAAVGDKSYPRDLPIMSIGEGIIKALNDLQNDEVAEAVKKFASETVGPLAGLPIKQILNSYEGLQDIGDDEAGVGVLKLLGWSPWAIEQNLE